MKPTLEIGIIQQSKTADISDNRRKLADAVARLADKGAKLIVNQELHDTLYFCQTESVECFDLATDIKQGNEAYDFYADLAKRHNIVLVVSLFERRAPGLCHNTAIVFETDGSEAGRYRKMHIPDDPAYYEKFYFTPGDLGFKPIATSVGRLGLLVCWDQWFPEAARLMALAGAELLIYPTSRGWESTDTPDEQERQRQAWMTIQRGHAVANGLPVV
ncbi:MAG: acyltransferase, partial [Paramuribaculum sp.]|nr:acyltransferase [Paramuribaculum sp.]